MSFEVKNKSKEVMSFSKKWCICRCPLCQDLYCICLYLCVNSFNTHQQENEYIVVYIFSEITVNVRHENCLGKCMF